MSEAIIVAVITAGFPMLATILTARKQTNHAERNAAKQSILQMILEDHMAVQEGHLPTNYQQILHEYDIYHSHGGNSYITRKVDDYKSWHDELEKAQAGKA